MTVEQFALLTASLALLFLVVVGAVCAWCLFREYKNSVEKVERRMTYKDWIVRYYSSHEVIPEGHEDGEMRELVHCGECFIKGLCVIHRGMQNDNGFCAWGLKERKSE